MLQLSLSPPDAARLLLLASMRAGTFDPDQARDERGQWTSGGLTTHWNQSRRDPHIVEAHSYVVEKHADLVKRSQVTDVWVQKGHLHGGVGQYGQYSPTSRTISIGRHREGTGRYVETLVHELTHAVQHAEGRLDAKSQDKETEASRAGAAAHQQYLKDFGLMPGLRGAGGEGSGNFGHAGRPGEVGGSSSDDSSVIDARSYVEHVRSWGPPNPFNPREIVVNNEAAITLRPFEGEVHIESIRAFWPAKGVGPRVMTRICDLADKAGVTLTLTAKPLGGQQWKTPKKGLVEFYKAFGFRRDRFGDHMARPPRASRAAEFNPDQARDEAGRWIDSGGISKERNPYAPFPATEESSRQEQLAAAQTNPLAHPEFVIGLGSHGTEALRYVAAYGQEFKASPLPPDVRSGKLGECYRNASLLVMGRSDLTYAEGFAQNPDASNVVFMHAWAVDRAGKVVDPTFEHPERCSYFGVKYERMPYLKYLYKAEIFGVLGSTHNNQRRAIVTGGAGLRALAEWDEAQHPRDERGQFSESGGSDRNEDLVDSKIKVGGASVLFDPQVTDNEAAKKIQAYAAVINPSQLGRVHIFKILVYDNSEDAIRAIDGIVGDRFDVPGSASGMFDRKDRTLVATLWNGDEESGEVFYHEVGHASENLITSARWEKPWTTEWSNDDQDEGFAKAFAVWHVAKYEDVHPLATGWLKEQRANESAMGEFKRLHPNTHDLFTAWGL